MTTRAVTRVAVTGMGLRTSSIASVAALRAALAADPASTSATGAVTDDELLERFSGIRLAYLDETAKYALVAAADALAHAGLCVGRDGCSSDDIGLVVGTLSGPIKWGFDHGYIEAAAEWDNPPVPAVSSVVGYYGSLLGNLTIPLGLAGPAMILCNLDVSGTDAIGYAYEAIRHGKVPIMVAGGADAPTTPMVETGMARAGLALRGAQGAKLTAGAAMVVLEDWESARARGAHIHAEVWAYGTTTDLSGRDIRRAILDALPDGGRIDVVVGTGAIPHEADVLRAVLRDLDHAPRLMHVNHVSGFAAAASGGIQAVVSVCLLNDAAGALPARAGTAAAGPDDVKVVLQASTGLSRKTSMLLLFGGH